MCLAAAYIMPYARAWRYYLLYCVVLMRYAWPVVLCMKMCACISCCTVVHMTCVTWFAGKDTEREESIKRKRIIEYTACCQESTKQGGRIENTKKGEGSTKRGGRVDNKKEKEPINYMEGREHRATRVGGSRRDRSGKIWHISVFSGKEIVVSRGETCCGVSITYQNIVSAPLDQTRSFPRP